MGKQPGMRKRRRVKRESVEELAACALLDACLGCARQPTCCLDGFRCDDIKLSVYNFARLGIMVEAPSFEVESPICEEVLL